jgi:RND family efflux transporter MFP subunit
MARVIVRTAGMAAVATAVLTLAACFEPPVLDTRMLDEPPVPVVAQAATFGSIRAVLRAGGRVVGQEGAEFTIIAPEPARIVAITRHVGDTVTAGELLVQFDLTGASFDVTRQDMERAQAQAQVDTARAAHDRTRDLVERGFLPRLDLDTAERQLVDAELALQRASTAFASAQAAAGRAMVFAPFDGLVAERLHDPGDVAQPLRDAPVMRVVDPERLEIEARIPLADASRILPGAAARLTSPFQPTPVVLVVAAPPQPARLDPAGLVPVRLSFTAPVALAVDTRVELDIDAEERTGIVLVPFEAVLTDNDETFVIVIDDEDRAEVRPVVVGLQDARRVEIVEGVAEGELVLTRGHDLLRDGMLLTAEIEEPDPGATAGAVR